VASASTLDKDLRARRARTGRRAGGRPPLAERAKAAGVTGVFDGRFLFQAA
jgi:hypothetical protein